MQQIPAKESVDCKLRWLSFSWYLRLLHSSQPQAAGNWRVKCLNCSLPAQSTTLLHLLLGLTRTMDTKYSICPTLTIGLNLSLCRFGIMFVVVTFVQKLLYSTVLAVLW